MHDPSTVSPEGQKAAIAYQQVCQMFSSSKMRDSVMNGRLGLRYSPLQVLDFPRTFQIKFITPREFLNVPLDRPMKFACWVKSNTLLGESVLCVSESALERATFISQSAGDDDSLHHCVAAFISDVTPIGTPLGAHAAAGFK